MSCKEIVSALKEGNTEKVKPAVNAALSMKVFEKIEDMRVTVANKFLRSSGTV